MSRFDKYRKALRALRAECPTDIPIRVRLNHTSTASFGWTSKTKRGLTITVCTRYSTGRRCTDAELRDTIVHEWAHAMVSAPCTPGEGFHDALWGVAYAQAYRAAVED